MPFCNMYYLGGRPHARALYHSALMRYLLALDQGTTRSRALLERESGRPFANARLARPPVRPNGHLFGATEAGLFAAPIPVAGMAGDQQAATSGQACVIPGHRRLSSEERDARYAGWRRAVAQARLRP